MKITAYTYEGDRHWEDRHLGRTTSSAFSSPDRYAIYICGKRYDIPPGGSLVIEAL